MIFSDPPKTFIGDQQVSPEALNRNTLAARQQLLDTASFRYRRMVIPTNRSDAIMYSMTNMPYIIESIYYEGSYTGQPVLHFGTETVTLPADGFAGGFYRGAVLPSFFISGTNLAVSYPIFFTGGNASLMRLTINVRTDRFLADINFPELPDPGAIIFKDGDTLDAVAFAAQQQAFSNYGARLIQAVRPIGISGHQFFNVTEGTPQIDRITGPSGQTMFAKRLTGTIYTPIPHPGQNVTFNVDLNGGTGASNVISLGAGTVHPFSITPTTGTTFNPTNPATDLSIRVSVGPGGPIDRIDCFLATQE